MKENKEDMKVLPNGDVEGVIEYPEKEIEVTIGGVKKVIGIQPAYKVVNIIKKEKIVELYKYLNEQKDYFVDRIKACDETLEKTKAVDLEVLSKAILKLPSGKKLGQSKAQYLNRLAEEYYMKKGAIDSKKQLEKSLNEIEKQTDFLSKLI